MTDAALSVRKPFLAAAVKLMRESRMVFCKYGDPLCPCQDGDACHYENHPWARAMTPCYEWWSKYLDGAWLGRD
jgi:hypothetical protein